jgi:hypothetical protein
MHISHIGSTSQEQLQLQQVRSTQHRGPGLAPPHHKPAASRGACLASGDSDDVTDELKIRTQLVLQVQDRRRIERKMPR